jgi:hypothetical protein
MERVVKLNDKSKTLCSKSPAKKLAVGILTLLEVTYLKNHDLTFTAVQSCRHHLSY